jgi:hypothetical protein
MRFEALDSRKEPDSEGIDLAGRLGDPICVYGLTMMLRGNADGSAEGTATTEELISAADYIKVRLDNWGPTPLVRDSHSAFQLFLSLVLSETADFVKGLRA